MQLTSHLQPNDSGYPTEVLTAFDLHTVARTDGDIEVLTNAAEATTNLSCLAKDAAQRNGRGFGMIGRDDVG